MHVPTTNQQIRKENIESTEEEMLSWHLVDCNDIRHLVLEQLYKKSVSNDSHL